MTSCCGLDHHEGGYTARQRSDLERVLAFNRRLAQAIEHCVDISMVEDLLDPDPMRYMWVDEGGGRLTEYFAAADTALAAAPPLEGHRRASGRTVCEPRSAARPAVAAASDGRVLHAWIEWQEDVGERVFAALADSATAKATPIALNTDPADCFRPSAAFDAHGVPWVCYGRSHNGRVDVWAHRYDVGSGWSAAEQVSGTGHPSFNQEVVAHPDGSVEVVWQGPFGTGFGIWSRLWCNGAWEDEKLVSAGAVGNAWDPAVGVRPDGGSAYAWSEYVNGSYRVVLRIVDTDGALGQIRPVSSGSDYALHPSLAVTTDGAIWCAFDVIAIHGHGGSGPTRLRPIEELAEAPSHRGRTGERRFGAARIAPRGDRNFAGCEGAGRRSVRGGGPISRRVGCRTRWTASSGCRRPWGTHRGLPRAPPTAADDVLLGGRRADARPERVVQADHFRRQ